VLPFAACASDHWRPALQTLSPAGLRQFGQLLQGMKLVDSDFGDAHSLSTPHERVLARALGLEAADGLIPWAAWQHLQTGGTPAGQAWAHITPCCWAMGREHAILTDPAALGLQEEESRTLLAAMRPYVETLGITLHYLAPTRWLAEGEIFRHLPAASLDRVLGRNVDSWLPGAAGMASRHVTEGADTAPAGRDTRHPTQPAPQADGVAARQIRLLQNEMQMLLYTHPLNDARAARGERSVNSFWVSGSGALPEAWRAPAPLDSTVPRSLAEAAFNDDWAAYAQAWAALDASEGARLLALQQGGQAIRLSLCGERNALTFESSRPGLFTRIKHLLSPRPLMAVLEQL
jgi:hypothetical protein